MGVRHDMGRGDVPPALILVVSPARLPYDADGTTASRHYRGVLRRHHHPYKGLAAK